MQLRNGMPINKPIKGSQSSELSQLMGESCSDIGSLTSVSDHDEDFDTPTDDNESDLSIESYNRNAKKKFKPTTVRRLEQLEDGSSFLSPHSKDISRSSSLPLTKQKRKSGLNFHEDRLQKGNIRVVKSLQSDSAPSLAGYIISASDRKKQRHLHDTNRSRGSIKDEKHTLGQGKSAVNYQMPVPVKNVANILSGVVLVGGDLHEGDKFESASHLEESVANWARFGGFNVRVYKSDKHRKIYRCKGSRQCPFNIHFKYEQYGFGKVLLRQLNKTWVC